MPIWTVMFLKFWIVKNFYTEPVYKDKYLRTSIKPYVNMIKADIHNSELPMDNSVCMDHTKYLWVLFSK